MVCGWDIGGVNTKAATVLDGRIESALTRAFELQRDPDGLVPLLRLMAAEFGADGPKHHAVTMTAELSQMFRTKREGVAFVLDALDRAFPADDVRIFTVDRRFLSPAGARQEPLAVAAANWSATAHAVAARHPDALLIDVGTTTTDCIPIVCGRVVAAGWTDPDRLASGELIYTGALRTAVEAIVTEVPYRDGSASVSAEAFALTGDVHLWRGAIEMRDYTVPTPDGRPAAPCARTTSWCPPPPPGRRHASSAASAWRASSAPTPSCSTMRQSHASPARSRMPRRPGSPMQCGGF